MKPHLLALATLIAGCPRSEAPPQPASSGAQTADAARASCPMGIPAAHIAAADTPDGVEMIVKTDPAHVDELRMRTRNAVAAYGAGAHRGLGHDGGHLGAHVHGLRFKDLPEFVADVQDRDEGVWLRLAPKDPARLEELRTRFKARLAIAQSMPCD